MKQNQITVVLFVFLFTSLVTWPQTVGVPVEGKVTQEGQPLANAQVVLTNIDNGKTYKTKTDKTGAFSMVGVPRGNFNVEVLGEKGEKLFKQPTAIGSEQGGTGANAFMTIDVPKGGAAGLDVSAPKLTKEEIAKIEADNKKIAGLNSLIKDSESARQAQDWPKAENALKQLIAAAPESSRWDFYMFLGEAQSKQNKFQDAAESYDKGIKAAEEVASGSVRPNDKIPALNAASAKNGLLRMLTAQGNAYLKLEKPDQGIAALKKATQVDPSSALAAYNLCGVTYTAAKVDDAKAACNKYLQLEPNGPHAEEVKGFLATLK
ncbi:MAG TPA: tetratricopeptide repeat protein [Candidatus Angelobacter sp.]|nr:tetratricopeptide repeat protein [Candidatus Angelobacter sp.]